MSNPLKGAENAAVVAALASILLVAAVIFGGGLVTFLIADLVIKGASLSYFQSLGVTLALFWTGAVVRAGASVVK